MIRHGFLQAGGGSTRFGTDKALVQLAGKTMLQRTVELLAQVCDNVRVVAPAGKYNDVPWPVIADRWPGEGPLGGILTALLNVNQLAQPQGHALPGHLFSVVTCPFSRLIFLPFWPIVPSGARHRSSCHNHAMA